MTKTSAKFQKDQQNTVGGVAHTKYLLVGGHNHRTMESRKAEYYVPSLFFEKAGDNKEQSTKQNEW